MMNRLDTRSTGAAWASGLPVLPASDAPRPPRQLSLSVLSMLLASLAGLSLVSLGSPGFFCSTITRPSGANVVAGGEIAFVAGIVGILASVLVRNRARLLTAVLVMEAAALCTAIGFVASDSAFVKMTQDCGFFGPDLSTSTHHVEYAYVLVGLAIVVLLAQAARGVVRSAPNSGRPA